MNGKTAKIIRKTASLTKRRYKNLKRAWNATPKPDRFMVRFGMERLQVDHEVWKKNNPGGA